MFFSCYLQVAYLLASPETIEREFSALDVKRQYVLPVAELVLLSPVKFATESVPWQDDVPEIGWVIMTSRGTCIRIPSLQCIFAGKDV
ncbi:MAG: hypothetical protein GQ565_08125 [Candidatus Aegiribacteria sp.]|nr:hypothetical protein [Candidatus Aegiribacteria sp.]